MRLFYCFVLPVFVYWLTSVVLISRHTLSVTGQFSQYGQILTDTVVDCNLAQRRPVAVLCMLCKTRSDSMNLLAGELPALRDWQQCNFNYVMYFGIQIM